MDAQDVVCKLIETGPLEYLSVLPLFDGPYTDNEGQSSRVAERNLLLHMKRKIVQLRPDSLSGDLQCDRVEVRRSIRFQIQLWQGSPTEETVDFYPLKRLKYSFIGRPIDFQCFVWRRHTLQPITVPSE